MINRGFSMEDTARIFRYSKLLDETNGCPLLLISTILYN